MHQIGPGESLQRLELLLENMGPRRGSDCGLHTAELPADDGGDVAGEQAEFVLEPLRQVVGGAGVYSQQQRPINRAAAFRRGHRCAVVGGTVDVADCRISQNPVEDRGSAVPFVGIGESQAQQEVAAVAGAGQGGCHEASISAGCRGCLPQSVTQPVTTGIVGGVDQPYNLKHRTVRPPRRRRRQRCDCARRSGEQPRPTTVPGLGRAVPATSSPTRLAPWAVTTQW